MLTAKEFSVIIPAFNEEEVLEAFLEDLLHVLSNCNGTYEIIVVDDGSTDNTFLIAGNIPEVNVINHPYNKGNGAAVKTGIMNAQGEKLVIIDADGQHDPKHIPEMMKLLDEYDLVVGARETFQISRRGFGNVFVSKMASYLSGTEIADLTCGFRAFKKEKMLEFIGLLPNGYSLPSTSTLAFTTTGYNVKFIPITAHIRQTGESNINILKDGSKFLVLIVRMISLFKPLKIFVPISVLLFIMSIVWSVRTIFSTGGISPMVAMLFLAGIFTLFFGLLVDQMAETRLQLGKINKLLIRKNLKDID
jgi:glycosyltransferase involved in cell wall biosynthesis